MENRIRYHSHDNPSSLRAERNLKRFLTRSFLTQHCNVKLELLVLLAVVMALYSSNPKKHPETRA